MAIFGIKTRADHLSDRLASLEKSNRALALELADSTNPNSGYNPGLYNQDENIWGQFKSSDGKYIATSVDVYACQKIRADGISSVKLKLYQESRSGGKDGKVQRIEITDHPLLTLLDKVNPHWTYSKLIKMTSYSLDTYGVCYWGLEAPVGGMPTEIWWLDPTKVEAHKSPTNYISGYTYKGENGKTAVYKPEEMVCFMSPNVNDEFTPLSPLSVLRIGLEIKQAMQIYNRAFFSNYGAPSVTLETDGNPQPAEAIAALRSFEKITRGADRAHSTALLPAGIKAKVLAMSQKDSEFIEGGKVLTYDVCRVYAVPPPLIASMDASTYNNINMYRKALWENGLIPALCDMAGTLNEVLLPLFTKKNDKNKGYFLEFDYADVEALQQNQLERWRIYEVQVGIGVKTINEIRAEENLPPLPAPSTPTSTPGMAPAPGVVAVNPDQSGGDVLKPPSGNSNSGLSYSYRLSGLPPVLAQGVWDQGQALRLNPPLKIAAPDPHAVYWYAFNKAASSQETDFAKEFQKWLDKLEKELENYMVAESKKSVRVGGQEALEKGFLDGIKQILNTQEMVKGLVNNFLPVMTKTVTAGADFGAGQLADQGGASVKPVPATTLRGVALERVKGFAGQVAETTSKAILDKIEQNQREQGRGNIADHIASVSKVFKDWKDGGRAETVGVTETNGGMNEGAITLFGHNGVTKKTWITELDKRVRETHVRVHGETVPITGKFMVNGYAMEAPGDRNAPASETVNCRCSVAPTI